jgi:hypothetical protein
MSSLRSRDISWKKILRTVEDVQQLFIGWGISAILAFSWSIDSQLELADAE